MKRLALFLMLLTLGFGAGAQKIVHLNRYAAANAALPPAEGPRVVLYGDSITDGWASQRKDFFAATGFIGRGISGEETAQMLLRFRADVIDIGASTMVLLAGINDIAQNMGDPYVEDVTYANILSMVDLCWQNGIRPVICGVLPSYNLRWRPEVTDTYEKVLSLNARLKAYCERRRHLHRLRQRPRRSRRQDQGGVFRRHRPPECGRIRAHGKTPAGDAEVESTAR